MSVSVSTSKYPIIILVSKKVIKQIKIVQFQTFITVYKRKKKVCLTSQRLKCIIFNKYIRGIIVINNRLTRSENRKSSIYFFANIFCVLTSVNVVSKPRPDERGKGVSYFKPQKARKFFFVATGLRFSRLNFFFVQFKSKLYNSNGGLYTKKKVLYTKIRNCKQTMVVSKDKNLGTW